MKFIKDGVVYNTRKSKKIGEPIECDSGLSGIHNERLYLSKNKQYYLLYTENYILFSQPVDVKVLSDDEAFRWAVEHLSAGTVEKHFPDKIKQG